MEHRRAVLRWHPSFKYRLSLPYNVRNVAPGTGEPRRDSVAIWLTLLASIVLTAIVGWQMDDRGIDFGSGLWLLLSAFTIYTPFSVYWGVKLLFFPITVPPPEEVAKLTRDLRQARWNFCAVSSKQLALWQSPTFLFYLMVNTVKSLIEYTRRIGAPPAEISTDQREKDSFHDQGMDLLEAIGQEKPIESFFGIRLLIYPNFMYSLRKNFIVSLLAAHNTGRVHCIPLVKENLVDRLNSKEKQLVREFAAKLGQRPNAVLAPVVGLARALVKAIPDPFPIPDFLVVDDTLTSRSTAGAQSNVWWYEGRNPRSDHTLVADAHKVFALLCREAREAVWSGYTSEKIEMLTIVDPETRRRQFFAQDFFSRWLETSSEHLQRWREAEDQLLLETVQPGSTVLDVGCGFGRHMELLLDKRQCSFVAGVDDSPKVVQRAMELRHKHGERVCVFLQDASRLPWAPDTFDYVICMTNTFGNMPAAGRHGALEEMKRVVKSQGKVILSVYAHEPWLLDARMKSYKEVGLHPHQHGKTVVADEGLESEEFDEREIVALFAAVGLPSTIRRLNRVGFACVGSKP
jgi:SAM-dependent methyltransferase